MITIPNKMREATLFPAHGKTWQIKRIRRDCWYLAEYKLGGPSRFGTRKQIIKDVGYLLESGHLPHSKAKSWA